MAGGKGYGQFCPVALAAEILAERWTPLLVRELCCGSVRFNELQRGVPRMSSSLLARRLKELERAGIIERRRAGAGKGWTYHLTPAGRGLQAVVDGMGDWAQRWLRDELVADRNLDPDLLMWNVRRRVNGDRLPRAERYVVRFEFAGMPANRRCYWLVCERGELDVCVKDPGFEVRLVVVGDLRTLTGIWLGHVRVGEAIRRGRLYLDGRHADIRAFAAWFALSVPAGRQPPAVPALQSP